MHITLEQPARARLVTEDRELPVPATLRYTSGDPLAVPIDFPADVSLKGEQITWTFARTLLDEGLSTPPAPVTCASGRTDGPIRSWSSTPRTAWP